MAALPREADNADVRVDPLDVLVVVHPTNGHTQSQIYAVEKEEEHVRGRAGRRAGSGGGGGGAPLGHDLLVRRDEATVLRHHLLALLEHLGSEDLAHRVVCDRNVLANSQNLVQQLRGSETARAWWSVR